MLLAKLPGACKLLLLVLPMPRLLYLQIQNKTCSRARSGVSRTDKVPHAKCVASQPRQVGIQLQHGEGFF
jgi:hypothetical protein